MTTFEPIIEGWFTTGEDPGLLGLRCGGCATTVFPPVAVTCPNPACRSDELGVVVLPRTGTVWSWAVNHYEPPAPYVAADPFVPYTVVAVELDGVALTVLGQLDAGDDPSALTVGTPVEVVLGVLLGVDAADMRAMFRFRVRSNGAGEVGAEQAEVRA